MGHFRLVSFKNPYCCHICVHFFFEKLLFYMIFCIELTPLLKLKEMKDLPYLFFLMNSSVEEYKSEGRVYLETDAKNITFPETSFYLKNP